MDFRKAAALDFRKAAVLQFPGQSSPWISEAGGFWVEKRGRMLYISNTFRDIRKAAAGRKAGLCRFQGNTDTEKGRHIIWT